MKQKKSNEVKKAPRVRTGARAGIVIDITGAGIRGRKIFG